MKNVFSLLIATAFLFKSGSTLQCYICSDSDCDDDVKLEDCVNEYVLTTPITTLVPTTVKEDSSTKDSSESGSTASDATPASSDATPASTDATPAPTDAKPTPTDAKPTPTEAKPTPTDAKPTFTDATTVSSNTANTDSNKEIVSTDASTTSESSEVYDDFKCLSMEYNTKDNKSHTEKFCVKHNSCPEYEATYGANGKFNCKITDASGSAKIQISAGIVLVLLLRLMY